MVTALAVSPSSDEVWGRLGEAAEAASRWFPNHQPWELPTNQSVASSYVLLVQFPSAAPFADMSAMQGWRCDDRLFETAHLLQQKYIQQLFPVLGRLNATAVYSLGYFQSQTSMQ